jgi:glucokinase
MIIGLDIGGHSIKAGLVSNNKIIKKIKISIGKNKKQSLKNIFEIIKKLDNNKVKSIGIGIPGPADYEKGVIGKTLNLPLNNINLKSIISKKFKKKVVMSNDANCFVLGESIRLKKKNVVGLTLGTGVGGGIVIDGKLYHGKGNAAELGHSTIKYDGVKSKCGNNGCIESYVSARGIKRDYGKSPDKLKSTKAWNEIGEKLGITITNLANVFDPDVIVIGGGISNAYNLFQNSMNKTIKKRTFNKVKVVKGSQDSGILGAASLILYK